MSAFGTFSMFGDLERQCDVRQRSSTAKHLVKAQHSCKNNIFMRTATKRRWKQTTASDVLKYPELTLASHDFVHQHSVVTASQLNYMSSLNNFFSPQYQ